MLWNNARRQGRVAGSNTAGVNRRYGDSVNITTVGFESQSGTSAGYLATTPPTVPTNSSAAVAAWSGA